MKAQSEVINQTVAYVREQLSHDGAGHGWAHVRRVWRMAGYLQSQEGGNREVIELAALLHDIADWKFSGDEDAGPNQASAWLQSIGVDASTITAVTDIVRAVTFKGAQVPTPAETIEAKIVQDADRLDALGAVGIARCFAYGGFKGQPIFDPEIPVTQHTSFEEYKSAGTTSVGHFYEKLLLLKNRLNTVTARKIAAKRHAIMEQFLEQFLEEWHGKDF